MNRHAPNAIVVGLYYRVTRKLAKGQGVMHTFMPVDDYEMPVEAGDVITKHTAPRGLDAALCIADFSELVGPAYPEVTRVTVFDGILINEADGHMEGFDRFRPVPSMKHALKLQARFNERRTRTLEVHARYMAERAQDVYIGKSHRAEAVSMDAAMAMGFGPGWYVRKPGNDNWSLVTSAYADGKGLIFGYRASRYRHNDGGADGYKLVTETFHPSLNELIIRPTRPTFGPVVDADGYQPLGWDTKIPYFNV